MTIFACSAMAATASKKAEVPTIPSKYAIKVSVTDRKMWLYCDGQLEKEYVVATGKKTVPTPEGEGRILQVIFKPSWHPMPETRKEYLKKGIELPEDIPYGDKLHMLGPFKMVLTHHSTRYPFSGGYAIHGNVNEASIGKRASGGCIRMHNKEGLELAKKLKPEVDGGRAIKVTIEP